METPTNNKRNETTDHGSAEKKQKGINVPTPIVRNPQTNAKQRIEARAQLSINFIEDKDDPFYMPANMQNLQTAIAMFISQESQADEGIRKWVAEIEANLVSNPKYVTEDTIMEYIQSYHETTLSLNKLAQAINAPDIGTGKNAYIYKKRLIELVDAYSAKRIPFGVKYRGRKHYLLIKPIETQPVADVEKDTLVIRCSAIFVIGLGLFEKAIKQVTNIPIGHTRVVAATIADELSGIVDERLLPFRIQHLKDETPLYITEEHILENLKTERYFKRMNGILYLRKQDIRKEMDKINAGLINKGEYVAIINIQRKRARNDRVLVHIGGVEYEVTLTDPITYAYAITDKAKEYLNKCARGE